MELTTREKRRRLPFGIAHGATNTIFAQVTFGASVFALFLNELGLPKSDIGLIRSLLPFAQVTAVFTVAWVARLGYKRAFTTFYGGRKLIFSLLLLAPAVGTTFGSGALTGFVVAVMAVFALFRALAETGLTAWQKEYIPDDIRGSYTAAINIVATVAGIGAATVAGMVVSSGDSMSRYLVLFAVGAAIGVVGVGFQAMVPGGAPAAPRGAPDSADTATATVPRSARAADVGRALGDRRFVLFLVASALVNAVFMSLVSFIPLYFNEGLGLPPGTVVLLDNALLVGILVFSYFWGWIADRWGGRPVAAVGIAVLIVTTVLLTAIPAGSALTAPAAFAAYLFVGAGHIGFYIGKVQLLYNRLATEDTIAGYAAANYAAMGLVGGFGPLVSGWVIELSDGSSGYPLVFLGASVLLAVAAVMIHSIRLDSGLRTRDLVKYFLYRNPLSALALIVSAPRALAEEERIGRAQRIAEIANPLNEHELLEMLDDPSFQVRYQAVLSALHLPESAAVTKKLIAFLGTPNTHLAAASAWALGRLGARAAVPQLLELFRGGGQEVRGMAARALGLLQATEAKPDLILALHSPESESAALDYAAALAGLGGADSLTLIIDRLAEDGSAESRNELVSAASRILEVEAAVHRGLRRLEADRSAALVEAAEAARTKAAKSGAAGVAGTLAEARDRFLALEIQAGAKHTLSAARAALSQPDRGDALKRHGLELGLPHLEAGADSAVLVLVLALIPLVLSRRNNP